MEIFSPGPVPYPGCYQCPRCNSREVYDSEKTIGVSAMTIDVPGPVNSTIVNVDRVDAKRCRYCNSVAPYIMHPKAKEEFDARRRRKIEKNLKRLALVLGILVGIYFAFNAVNAIGNKIESSKLANEAADGNSKLEEVRSNWQSINESCGLNEPIKVEEVPSEYTSPQVSIYFKIESSSEFSNFWGTSKGIAVDCFSKEVYGVPLSSKLSFSQEQLKRLGFFGGSFYDGVEKDGSIFAEGVIADSDEHLDGSLTYWKDDDSVSISMYWELDKSWSRD